MPDPIPTPAGGDNPPANPNPTPAPGATDPTPKPGSGGDAAFDPTTLSDDHLTKVLEDPRLWKTPRMTALRDSANKLKGYEKAEADRVEADLKKKGDFETLSTQQAEKLAAAETRYQKVLIDNQVMAEATKLGITDIDAANKLIERGEIKVGDDGSVTGVTEAIAKLATDKPYLIGKQQVVPVGGGTNPVDPGASDGIHKISDVNKPAYYAKHHKAIKIAMAKGQIDMEN